MSEWPQGGSFSTQMSLTNYSSLFFILALFESQTISRYFNLLDTDDFCMDDVEPFAPWNALSCLQNELFLKWKNPAKIIITIKSLLENIFRHYSRTLRISHSKVINSWWWRQIKWIFVGTFKSLIRSVTQPARWMVELSERERLWNKN